MSLESKQLPEFWDMYYELPKAIREKARSAYRKFKDNPEAPGLNFEPLAGWPDLYSVRINKQYRAVGLRDGNSITWTWIGTHNKFDKHFG